jgi:hypothetical protein
MKDEILTHLNDPGQLEKLYRSNKGPFKREFSALYPELKGNTLADFWNERLLYDDADISWGTGRELVFVILASLFAGLVAKLPTFLTINEDFFYPRNIGFIIFPVLAAYFAWKNEVQSRHLALLTGVLLLSLLYINLLPDNEGDTLLLACIHLPLLLWIMLGLAFAGDQWQHHEKRLAYLRYNGDLVVMTTLILISGAILAGITIGLFSLIGFQIEQFYFEYVVVFGLAASPVVGTYLTQTNPQLVNKVSPVIARIFCPLVLLTLVIYLIATVFSAKDPYNDRDFLLLFNLLLIGVMAIIFFSVAENSRNAESTSSNWVLLLLSVVTILVNGIALSAILFRISEWGITPNRLAVMGGNILILINLLLVTVMLFRVVLRKTDTGNVGKTIVAYLPVYGIWSIIVIFLFPLLFGFE